ncbi:MAG TPA: response regulator [Polyangia bacterium]|jgi:two-component system response regulator RegA
MTAQPMLLVDDDEVFRERLATALRQRGQEVVTASDGEAAMQAAGRGKLAAAVVDLRMPGMSGTELVPHLLSLQPELRIVVLTGYGSIASAVEAMRLGAHNYVSKPADADDVLAAVTGEARPMPTASGSVSPPPTLARAEWEHIQRILADTGGNVSETARRLGITRRTLQLKLKKYPPRV